MLRDPFTYTINVFSNYSLYNNQFGESWVCPVRYLTDSFAGGYGSEIYHLYERALQSPVDGYKAIHSSQHAKGWINMDDWPVLRHAINGTGETSQEYAYTDGRGQSYFRELSAKNDGWVYDNVWGSLRDGNPPVPPEQIWGPEGGPGFRKRGIVPKRASNRQRRRP